MYFLFALAATAAAPADNATMLDRMVSLYDTICLQKFPDDAAAGAAVVAAGGEPLSSQGLINALYGRHGQGWRIADGDGDFIVTIENPPYHQCSIRRAVAKPVSDISAYRALADRYEATKPGFTPIPSQTFTQDGVAAKGYGEVLKTGDSSESLMFFNNSPAKGSKVTVTDFRLIHLFHSGAPDAVAPAEK